MSDPVFQHPGESDVFTKTLVDFHERLKHHNEADRKRALLKLAVQYHIKESTKQQFLDELERMFGPSLAQAIQDVHASYLHTLLDNPATDPDLKAVLTAVLDTKEG